MHVETCSIKTGGSFSPASLSTLDSEETLVLIFGAPDLIDTPHRIREVVDACPRSHVMGCSTAGEIHGCEISDDSMAVATLRFDNTPIRTAQAAAERAQEESTRRKQSKQQDAAPTPDDFIKTVQGKIGDHAAEWFKKHREFITDDRLHKRRQTFGEDWVDRNGENAVRTAKFTEALDERFGFAQAKKAAPAPEPAEEEVDMEEKHYRGPERQKRRKRDLALYCKPQRSAPRPFGG
jgi:hypothetical protein